MSKSTLQSCLVQNAQPKKCWMKLTADLVGQKKTGEGEGRGPGQSFVSSYLLLLEQKWFVGNLGNGGSFLFPDLSFGLQNKKRKRPNKRDTPERAACNLTHRFVLRKRSAPERGKWNNITLETFVAAPSAQTTPSCVIFFPFQDRFHHSCQLQGCGVFLSPGPSGS